jgi:hypothetical protein
MLQQSMLQRGITPRNDCCRVPSRFNDALLDAND